MKASTPTIEQPRARSASTRCEPMKPAQPVTRYVRPARRSWRRSPVQRRHRRGGPSTRRRARRGGRHRRGARRWCAPPSPAPSPDGPSSTEAAAWAPVPRGWRSAGSPSSGAISPRRSAGSRPSAATCRCGRAPVTLLTEESKGECDNGRPTLRGLGTSSDPGPATVVLRRGPSRGVKGYAPDRLRKRCAVNRMRAEMPALRVIFGQCVSSHGRSRVRRGRWSRGPGRR